MSTPREVAELERRDRLEEAAVLAEKLGAWSDAARLWERTCRYDRASLAALASGGAAEAVDLAVRAGDPELEHRAMRELAKTPQEAGLVAARLSDQGRHASAARLWLALGDAHSAGLAFERVGLWLDAAKAHLAASDPRRAARALEQAVELGSDGFEASLMLGRLYAEHARHDAAVRVLQRIPKQAPERREALPILSRSLDALGLTEAVAELAPELQSLGPTPAPEPTRTEELEQAVLFGRYKVLDEVARTPTARVVRAVDQIGGGEVAVKLFSAASLRDAGRDALVRFEREAVALGKLRHPAIVPLRGYYPEGPAVVLEWMAGGSLADLLEKDTISPARAAEIAVAVLGALAEAHRRGILHRDIKPANVLFDAAGAAYLADFGTAHVADAAATVTSGVIGTLAYMAPEQRAGAPANAKSDIYGAGALLWHALTDGPPAEERDFLSGELSDAQRALAERLIGPESGRPENAVDARELLRAQSFPREKPTRVPRSLPPSSRRGTSSEGRLVPVDGQRHLDHWLGRELWVIDRDSPEAERARAFARADQRAFATVLAAKPEDGTLWVEAVTGEPVTALGAEERARLADALRALHQAGGRHGAVDAAHLVRRGGEVVLAFPRTPADESPERDLEKLGALL